MKILLIALIIAILFTLFLLPGIVRAYARSRADQITYGRRPVRAGSSGGICTPSAV